MDNQTIYIGQPPDSPLRRLLKAIQHLVWPGSATIAYKIAVIATCAIIAASGATLIILSMRNSPAKNPSGQSSTEDKQTGNGSNNEPSETPSSSGNTSEEGTAAGGGSGSSNGSSSKAKPGTGGTSGGSGSTGSSGSGSGSGGGGSSSPPLTCAAFPSFPDANCTGWQHTGVTLHDCDTNLTENNTTYDSCLFDGGIVVVGTNITVKRSKITGIVSPNWDANGSLRGLTMVDVEIDGTPYFDPLGQAAIGIDNYTCIRCNVHNTGRGANFRNNVRIEDSYFHDFVYVSGAHQSGVGSNGGSNNTILHSNIECNGVGGSGCSGALVMYGDFDPVDNILIQNNLFNTDGGFCTYGGSAGVASGKAYPHGTNVRYIDNRFGKKHYSTCGDVGPVAAWENNSGNVWSGNAWQDGSGTVNP